MVFEIVNYEGLKRAVDDFCAFLSLQDIPEERIFDSRLAAFELLGNALKHAEGGARFSATVEKGYIELNIVGKTAFYPPEKSECAELYSEHGRGFYLIDSVCTERKLTGDGGILVRIKIG
jgi:anti-sigma regulatory factor (Ser/Thr protein kinase)